jgi:hypothetical protein
MSMCSIQVPGKVTACVRVGLLLGHCKQHMRRMGLGSAFSLGLEVGDMPAVTCWLQSESSTPKP